MSELDRYLDKKKDGDVNVVVDKIIKEKDKVDIEPERPHTPVTRKKLRIKFAFGKDKKERKRIMMGEHNSLIDRERFFLFLFIGALFVITMLFTQFPEGRQNEAVRSIILLVGMFLFLPIGFVVGAFLLDPVKRCKIVRKITHKNFGLIFFVAKGKKVFTRMKNFDDDLLFIKNKCWAFTKSGIYELDPDGERLEEGDMINPDGVLTISETVPIIFLDMKSIEPLVFDNDDRERIQPEELGSFLKGWTDNQLAKIMFLRRTLDIYFIIVIICCIAAAFFSYQNYTAMEEMKTELEAMKKILSNMIVSFVF
ncbi:MAG TPA: hypothetical protein ENI36_03780 [Thermoplasmatales archaeon]|nr:hypothetical protein [Thermoplasmatales archaeon]